VYKVDWDSESCKLPASATLLDSRFKKAAFYIEENATSAQEFVNHELSSVCKEIVEKQRSQLETTIQKTCDSITASSDELWNFFHEKVYHLKKQSTPVTNASVITRQYLELPYKDRTSSPTQFWNKHKSLIPQLHQLALSYLSVPATSVPSERIFSKEGLITNKR
jgi:hypothetical protein